MRARAGTSLLTLLALVATACGAGPDGGRPAALSGTRSPDDNRTLVIAIRTEPQNFVGADLNPTHVGNTPDSPWQIFHAGLTQKDEMGTPQIQLAEAFPELGTDSWKVFPDGRMETIWRLRPNLTWHDGAPLVARDAVLSAQFLKSVGKSSAAVPAVEEANAPDDRTVVLRYKALTPIAGQTALQPLPAHLLSEPLEQLEAPEALYDLPYWTTQFVGLGPYRLDRWESGAFITGVAFPGYVNGKPRIGRVQLVWISDANTTVANLLSGTVNFATDLSVAFEQASVLKREWAASGEPGAILLGTARTVYVQIQFRPEYTNPAALLDVRFRQALAHAMNKQAIVDAVLDGEPGMADTLMAKDEEFYPELDKALMRYPLDLRRTEELLLEMGFAKGREGFYSQGGTRLTVGLTPRGDYIREALILADGWKRVGLDTPIRTLSAAEQLDTSIGRTLPALSVIQFQIDALPLQAFTTGSGPNVGGYSDPQIDRFVDIYSRSLDRSERNRAVIQAMKLLSDQAAYFPLYYGYGVVAYTAGLTGPRSGRAKTAMWKMEEWRWQ